MRYLSLFSGCCGGDLGLQHLLNPGWECMGYVEWEEYCQKLIRQRQEDGFLTKAPIFGDIREFISQGYAAKYRGMVDCITGGFPCQPFSVAGKRAGADDERNMWPATIEAIRMVRPRYAFLENVPGLLTSGYFGTILRELAEAWYDARWCVLSAKEAGAQHERARIFIFANATNFRNKNIKRIQGYISLEKLHEWSRGTNSALSTYKLNPPKDPDFTYRADDGLSEFMDRHKAAGNAQVPIVAATAWRILSGEG